MTIEPINRRTVLRGAALVGAAAGMTACGGEASPQAAETAAGIGAAPAPTAAETSLGSTADVPVGGGRIYKMQRVVVTQPTTGSFKAFSAECTHQGCLVSSVEENAIRCSCHNSSFSISDGSVLGGPATAPLKEQTMTHSGGMMMLG